mmetsp:Transcript_26650/g.39193  ORF Transcript_26650/g.39193 Transcript_26650/m.39193 type:complete len:81 (+) Transcript_26650:196-438(+)
MDVPSPTAGSKVLELSQKHHTSNQCMFTEFQASTFASAPTTFHGLVDPLFVTSWHKWNRYKLHRGIELVPWHKEWPDGGI